MTPCPLLRQSIDKPRTQAVVLAPQPELPEALRPWVSFEIFVLLFYDLQQPFLSERAPY